MQRRCIDKKFIELIMEYGESRPAGRGCESLYFTKKAWDRMAKDLGSMAKDLERLRNAYIILASDGTIVTAARAH